MSKLPERINVMRVISYDVQDIVERLTENDETLRTVTLEEVMQQVESWVEEDFPADRIKDLIIQDQDGNEVGA
jgi:predicted transcriptional regulator